MSEDSPRGKVLPIVPRRFDSVAVARFEDTIRSMCHSWPEPIVVDPAPLAIETFRQRYRDAVNGMKRYDVGPTSLRALVRALQQDIVVSELPDGLLRIAPISHKRKRGDKPMPVGKLVSGVAPLADNETAVVGPDAEIIRAIALLTGHGILTGARITGVSEEFIYSAFPPDYEGGCLDNGDGSFSIY